jgi:Holliday junction resolvase RusA-like endonuclease
LTETVIDLPPPPSVNRTRRVDWSGHALVKAWRKHADGLFYERQAFHGRPKPVLGQFEATLILSEEHSGADLDNVVKVSVDYARHLKLIEDDGPKHMRKLTVLWGHAPHGCRLILRGINA